jgi:hypothetical protein
MSLKRSLITRQHRPILGQCQPDEVSDKDRYCVGCRAKSDHDRVGLTIKSGLRATISRAKLE